MRVVTETAWHNLFAPNMLIQMKTLEQARNHRPEFTIINVPRFHAVPELDGTSSEAFILLHLGKKLVLIGGTSYAGEIKKSVFTMLNYVLPQESVLSMHCSANVGDENDTAIFFGLSGTGKTTLSEILIRHFIKSNHDLYIMKTRSVAEIDEIKKWQQQRPVKSPFKIVYIEEFDKNTFSFHNYFSNCLR